MANPYNRIKQKTAEIFGQQIVDKADAMTHQVMADMLAKEIGKDVDELVDAMVAKTPEALLYRDRLRREIINEFANEAKTGEEPNLERAVRRAIEENDSNLIVQRQQPARNYVGEAAMRTVGMSREELEQRIAQISGFVKMMTGVANNAALAIMSDALDKITDKRSKESYLEQPRRPHPRYRQKVKQLFSKALSERDNYRRNLLYPGEQSLRFFRLSDMPEESRRRYNVMTDAQYFEFWEGTGALAYQKSQPLIGSLHNKFRLSLERHNVPCAVQVAWGLVAANVLELAVVIWQRAMRSAHGALDGILKQDVLEQFYQPFSLRNVSLRWQQALTQLAPETSGYKLDSDEERNIQLGVEQLMELWVSPDLPFDSTIHAVEGFSDDIFATKGFAKKTMRELAEMRNKAVSDLRQQFAEERRMLSGDK